MKNFKSWLDENTAAFEMENQIIADKLAEGIEGVEWLVYHTEVSDAKMAGLEHWLEFVQERQLGWIDVAANAFVMDSDSFYERYGLNWWICVDEAISVLKLIKDVNPIEYMVALSQIRERQAG